MAHELLLDLGAAGFALHSLLIVGFLSYLGREWNAPRGSYAFMICVNAIGMGFFAPTYPFLVVLSWCLGGVMIDWIFTKYPIKKTFNYRVFCLFVPTILIGFHMFAGIWHGFYWNAHMIFGIAFMAGGLCWFLSWLVVPPLVEE